jgi:hypothetical protein
MDEFIVILIIALVAIAALMVVGGPLADMAEGTWPGQGGGATGNYKSLTSFDLGNVGVSQNEVTRAIRFGSFTLGETQSDTLKSLPDLGVSQGYFGGDPKRFEINVNPSILGSVKDVKVSFGMGETNLYGNLIVKWNDKVVFDKLANLNRYDIVIDPADVKESNTLELSASTPGMYFWASTYYGLANFATVAEYGPEKFMSFKIYPNEIETWSKGVLKFYTTSGQSGLIRVKLNDADIYSSSNPEHLVSKEFQYSEIGNMLKIGDNMLSFKSDSVYEIDDAEFDVVVAAGTSVKERDFTVTSDNLNLLKGNGKGRIEFVVNSTYKQGVLNIKLNDDQLNIQTVRDGKNTIDFTSSDVIQGENTISFAGTGSWDINGVKIGIAY